MKKLGPILIGVALLVVSVGALFVVGRVVNPPAQEILVALTDLEQGQFITPDRVQVVSVRMGRAQLQNYLTPQVLEQRGFNVQVATRIAAGNFLSLTSLMFEGNPAETQHAALALDDPAMVAMVIPVTPLTCPPDIKAGDVIDITVDIGSAAFMTGTFGTAPTPEPYSPYTSTRPDIGFDAMPTIESPLSMPIQAPTSAQVMNLPVTKTVARATVIKVLYEVRLSGISASGGGTERGEVIGVVVAVPAQAQEVIGFGIHNGQVRVAILSPNASGDLVTAGVTWDDIVAYFRWNRELWLMDGNFSQPNIGAPGAAVIYPTLMATYYPSPTPLPTFTPVPGDIEIENGDNDVENGEGIELEPLQPTPTPEA